MRVFRLLASTWWVGAAKRCAKGRHCATQGWGLSSLHGWSSSRRLFTSEASAFSWLLALLHVKHGRCAGQRGGGNTCFRCLAPRVSQPDPRGRPKPPRESQFPWRSPQTVGGGNPTYRKAAPQASSEPPPREMLWRWSRHCVVLRCLRAWWTRCKPVLLHPNETRATLGRWRWRIARLSCTLLGSVLPNNVLRFLMPRKLMIALKGSIFNTGSCLWILSRRLLQRWPLKLVMVPNRKRCSRVPSGQKDS